MHESKEYHQKDSQPCLARIDRHQHKTSGVAIEWLRDDSLACGTAIDGSLQDTKESCVTVCTSSLEAIHSTRDCVSSGFT